MSDSDAPGATGIPPEPGTPLVPAVARTPVFSILSLIAGIAGFLVLNLAFRPEGGGVLTLFLPAAAIVFGSLGRTREPDARALWLTGLIAGIVGSALSLLSIVARIIAFAGTPMVYYTR